MYKLTIDSVIDVPDDGLLLGNGDISASFYQQPGRLVWRFGKHDIWDRRVEYSMDPRPAHIKELKRGIRDERWCCGPYGGEVIALNGTDNPERMKEICMGVPPSNVKRGYPCPKPAGELSLHYPPGMGSFKIEQTLELESGELRVNCSWANEVRLSLTAFIAPWKNLLFVNYRLEGYDAESAMGEDYVPPIYFSLCRTADMSPVDFAVKYSLTRAAIFPAFENMGGDPMEAPVVEKLDSAGNVFIEQVLPPENTYPEGLRCGLALKGGNMKIKVYPRNNYAAKADFIPLSNEDYSGSVAVTLETAVQREELIRKMTETLSADREEELQNSRNDAEKFWAASSISLPDDPLTEKIWYAALHARRIAYKKGFLPPGLVFPSTLQDYPLWHGDYHLNYNFQQPFYGDYSANHAEIGDSYFDAMHSIFQMGRLIAERYYDSTGTFAQLAGFPLLAKDDLLGCAPMGRMVYMTGWAGHQYYWRYLYTRDKDFLKNQGYPVLKSLAQFYLDFLERDDDGKYHAFPSNQGEDGFNGDPEAYRDLPQNMLHIRFALAAAEYAAKELGIDEDFRKQCRERIDNLADMKACASQVRKADDNWDEVADNIDSQKTRSWQEVTEKRGDLFPPEFLGFDGEVREYGDTEHPPYESPDFYCRRWYAGKFPTIWMAELRNRCFLPDRDWDYVRKILAKWMMPNGLLRAMALSMYGQMGAFTESTGIIAPIQDCLLCGHSDVLEVFPFASQTWKKAAFKKLRAAGGFLVSADMDENGVSEIEIMADADCTSEVKLRNPFGTNAFTSSLENYGSRDGILSAELEKNQIWKLEREE